MSTRQQYNSLFLNVGSLQALTANNAHRAVVVAYSSSLRLIKLNEVIDSNNVITPYVIDINDVDNICIKTASGMQGNFTLSDVSWNRLNSSKICTAGTTGDIFVVDLEISGARKSSSNIVGSWFSSDRSFSMDTKSSKNIVQQTRLKFSKRNPLVSLPQIDRAINKICWSNHHSDLIGAAFQDGTVKLFDCRSSRPSGERWISVFDPKANAARDIQFSAFNEHLVAGIFDNGCWCILDSRYPVKPIVKVAGHSSSGYTVSWHPTREDTIATGSRDKTIKIWNISGINASEAGVCFNGDLIRPEYSISTSCSVNRIEWRPEDGHEHQIASSTTERGEISIWNIHSLNVPQCVVQSKSDSCTDFAWMNMQSSRISLDESEEKIDKSKGNSQRPITYDEVITVGKDGKVNINYVSRGFYPRKHIAPHVSAISSKGSVAIQRGGRSQSFAVSALVAKSESVPPSSFKSPSNIFGNGTIYFGLANLSLPNLQAANLIRSVKPDRAEGNVFDPAMLYLLAQTYKTGWDGTGPRRACEHNRDAALSAGLRCRAAVWSTLLSILPVVVKPGNEVAQNIDFAANKDKFLPFSLSLLGDMLLDLLEGGDCLHFVFVSEILRLMGIADQVAEGISEVRRRETYVSLIDLLMKQELFAVATALIKVSQDSYISKMASSSINIHTTCSKCLKEISENPYRSPWCQTCKRCMSLCAVCQMPIRGLYMMCPVCGHGGHKKCLEEWFQLYKECPTGCEHHCCKSLLSRLSHEER